MSGGPAAVVDHVRRGDGQLGRRGARQRLKVGEILFEDRLRHVDLAAYVQRGGGELDVPARVVEPHRQVARRLADPPDLVDEVHVPGGTAELTVGGRLQAGVLLHRHHAGDGLILDGPQLLSGDPAGREIVAGREHAGGAEQTADMVGAERRSGSHGQHRCALRTRRSIRGVSPAEGLSGRSMPSRAAVGGMDRKAEEEPIAELLATTTTQRGPTPQPIPLHGGRAAG
jgi:hypothetical protein